ncbi:MAG: PIN-like domain-containing protein [Vibrio sp.]|uniref:PIN-like domain-containing protein n=1 Tax=Vibrio sp. TaxID=678 RepID=UPI003A8A8184
MKELFAGYSEDYVSQYLLNEKKIIVSFDANILLNLYRYEFEVKEQVVSLIENIKNKEKFDIWIPHHAALEFNVNRKKVINQSKSRIDDIRKQFAKFKKDVQGASTIGGKRGGLFSLNSELSECFDNMHVILERHKKNLNTSKKDKLIDTIFSVFDGHVGEPIDALGLDRLINEADGRFSKNIPPGFEDSDKTNLLVFNGISVDCKYGDYIIWRSLIDKSKIENLPVILISDDVKSDWRCNEYNRVKPELINEFLHETGNHFYSMSITEFERLFKSYLEFSFTAEASSQINNVTKNDRNTENWLGYILDAYKFYGRKTLKLKEINNYILNNYNKDFPATWDVIVRRTIYNHCSDLSAYLGKKDIFEKVNSGEYKLR